jgi:zinc transport system permease protein
MNMESLQTFMELLHTFRYAFVAGAAVAVACSLLSPLVVYKRMAFIGEGVSHAGFGGIGLALLASVWLPQLSRPGWADLVLALSCVATALIIGRLSAAAAIESDSAIGVGLVVAMAIGIAGIDLYSYLRPDAWQPDVHSLLFGDVLSADPASAAWAWVVALLTAALILGAYKRLVFYAFDEEGALIFGVPVRALHYLLLTVMALAIVAAMRLVGVVLVTALMVMPGLIGRSLAVSFRGVLAWSLGSGLAGVLLGLLLVMALKRFSSGPVVVLVLCAMLGAAAGYRKAVSRRKRTIAAGRPSVSGR